MTVSRPNEGSQQSAQDQPTTSARGKSLQLAIAAAAIARDNRGQQILILDLRDLTCIFDYFVIATGTSRRQLHAIADEIDHKFRSGLGDRCLGIEGYQGSGWILLDYGNVVVHLFEEEFREFYGIEKLWGEAKRVAWEQHDTAVASVDSSDELRNSSADSGD